MEKDSSDKSKDLNKVVKTRIKGLGLDALFHQVDVKKKDEDSYSYTKQEANAEDIQLLERLSGRKTSTPVTISFQKMRNRIIQTLNSEKPFRVGISLSPTAIKFVKIKKDKHSVRLVQSEYIPIPPIMIGSQEKIERFISETLKQLITPKLTKESLIYTYLPRDKVILKFLSLPSQERVEFRKMVEFEAEHHLPFPVDQAEYDFCTLNQENNKTEFLLAAIRKEDMLQEYNFWYRIGLNVDFIGLSSMALFDSMKLSDTANGLNMSIHIGARSTDINIVQEGILKAARGITWGSELLTEELQNNLNVNYENAEKIKKENGILLTQSDEESIGKSVSDLATQWADSLIKKISQTIQHYQLKEGSRPFDKIVITGGGSQLNNLKEYLSQKLQIRVTQQPLAKSIQATDTSETFHKHFYELNMLLGLVVNASRDENAEINLLPQRIKVSKENKKKRTRQLVSAGLVVLVLGFLFILPAGILAVRSTTLKGLDKQLSQIEAKKAAMDELRGRITTIEDYISTKQSCLDVLQEITLVVSEDIMIRSFTFEKNEEITLIGEAESHASVVDLSQILRENEFFESAKIRYTRKKDRLLENVDFEIICALSG